MTASLIIKTRCEQLGLTAQDLRQKLADKGQTMSRQRLWAWMNEEAVPSPDALPVLCEVLELDAGGAIDLYTASKIPLPAVLQPTQEAA